MIVAFLMCCVCLCDDDCRIFVCFRVIIVMILDVLCDDYHDFDVLCIFVCFGVTIHHVF